MPPPRHRVFRRLVRGRRHYIFDPAWGGYRGFGLDRTSTGAVKAQRVTLDRTTLPSHGSFRFAIREHLNEAKAAMLLFRATHMTLRDRLQVAINGTPVPPADLRSRDNEIRVDLRQPPGEEQIAALMREGYTREVAVSFHPGPSPPPATWRNRCLA